jgi:hypothetical protein
MSATANANTINAINTTNAMSTTNATSTMNLTTEDAAARAAFAHVTQAQAQTTPAKAVPKALASYKAVNIVELINHRFKPREHILSPWLLTQSLNMIYAWRGVGKTHVALGIGFAVASGGSFLGWKADKKRKVLYLDGEMPGASLQHRLTSLIESTEEDFDADHFRILTPDLQGNAMPDLATYEGQAAIAEVIGDAEIIIVDNLSSLARSGGRENDAESWQMIADWALHQRQRGKTVIFVHHSGKSGAQRGTSKREDILDTVISLKRPPDYNPDEGAKFEVHFEKGRDLRGTDVEPIEARLVTSEDGMQSWTVGKLIETTFGRVVALSNDGLTSPEIGEELGLSRSSVSRYLKKGREAGMLSCSSNE